MTSPPRLPPSFLTRPIAHRALHDGNVSCVENGMQAIERAVSNGFGIEVDVQLSADGQAMVFHDYDLGRLTMGSGPIKQVTADELGAVEMRTGEIGIPTLAAALAQIAGQVPLLIEIKDQDGAMGPEVGALEAAVARDLAGYEGDVGVMSFNPHAVTEMARLCPEVPRGLTTCDFRADNWVLPKTTRARLRDIPDFDPSGASFVSHGWQDLGSPAIAALKARGVPVLCWTVRSAEEEVIARRTADNITFESYLPEETTG